MLNFKRENANGSHFTLIWGWRSWSLGSQVCCSLKLWDFSSIEEKNNTIPHQQPILIGTFISQDHESLRKPESVTNKADFIFKIHFWSRLCAKLRLLPESSIPESSQPLFNYSQRVLQPGKITYLFCEHHKKSKYFVAHVVTGPTRMSIHTGFTVATGGESSIIHVQSNIRLPR